MKKNNCGDSCGCNLEKVEKNSKDKEKLNSEKLKVDLQESQNKKNHDEKLDPTHFGDWQVNCRTIDF